MTDAEWLTSDDPIAMIEALQANWRGEGADLVRLINRYLLACCRAIWPLLPLEASRRGVEVAERFLEGRATRDEFGLAEWQAEGAAFFLDPFEWEPEEEPEAREHRIRYHAERRSRIEELVKEIEEIPAEDMRRMVRATFDQAGVSPRQVLADAAYFADGAMIYSTVEHKEKVLRRYPQFLSASLLRDLVGHLYRPQLSRQARNR